MSNDRFSIRNATPEDAAFVLSLFARPHVSRQLHPPSSIDGYLKALEDVRLENLIIERDGKAFGNMVLELAPEWLLTIRVLAVWEQCCGAGTFAMAYAIRRGFDGIGVHRIFLEVLERNFAARCLYESVGFRNEGLYRDGYRDESGAFWNLVPYGLLIADFRSLDTAARRHVAVPGAVRSGSRPASNPSVTIRTAVEADFERLLTLFDDVAAERQWINTEPGFDRERYARAWRSIVGATDEVQFVAFDGPELVGSLSIYASANGEHDLGMLVGKPHRGRGIGTALLHAAFDWARRKQIRALTLGVFPHNTAAIALYQRMGFVETGRIANYITRQSGESWDVLRMHKRLD
jgi:ribosomal-protein-alanine N-acetyltransferase